MSCLPPETNKQTQPRGRTESVLRLWLFRVIGTVDGQITDTWPSDGIPSSCGAHVNTAHRQSFGVVVEGYLELANCLPVCISRVRLLIRK